MAQDARLLLLVLALASPSAADTITLINGRVIEADRAWIEGNQVRYEKDGGLYGVPRSLVRKLDLKPVALPSQEDPDIQKARAKLAGKNPVEAVRLLRLVLARDPRSIPGLQALAEAYLVMGDGRAARDAAEKAVRLDDRNPRSRSLLADALVVQGDRAGAEAEYRRSLQIHPDADVQRKLGEVAPPPARPEQGAQFRVRYDGGVNEPLGTAVLAVLTNAFAEYSRRLGFVPDEPVTVVLQTGTEFQEDTRVPPWAEGVNDGTIRVPVRGLNRSTPGLERVLRHELAHSFVTAKTGGNCPTWLQEGISQWLEGGDPVREDAALAPLARDGRLLPLLTLEAPFQNLSMADATLAYKESLSAVAHILRKRSEAGVVRLLSALGDRLPAEEALVVALALSYPELQESWEQHLRDGTLKK